MPDSERLASTLIKGLVIVRGNGNAVATLPSAGQNWGGCREAGGTSERGADGKMKCATIICHVGGCDLSCIGDSQCVMRLSSRK